MKDGCRVLISRLSSILVVNWSPPLDISLVTNDHKYLVFRDLRSPTYALSLDVKTTNEFLGHTRSLDTVWNPVCPKLILLSQVNFINFLILRPRINVVLYPLLSLFFGYLFSKWRTEKVMGKEETQRVESLIIVLVQHWLGFDLPVSCPVLLRRYLLCPRNLMDDPWPWHRLNSALSVSPLFYVDDDPFRVLRFTYNPFIGLKMEKELEYPRTVPWMGV